MGHEGEKEGGKTSRIVTLVGENTQTLHQRDMGSELATMGWAYASYLAHLSLSVLVSGMNGC